MSNRHAIFSLIPNLGFGADHVARVTSTAIVILDSHIIPTAGTHGSAGNLASDLSTFLNWSVSLDSPKRRAYYSVSLHFPKPLPKVPQLR
jgi:hypothetical protein